MPYWGCTVYQINQECDDAFFTDIIQNPNEEYTIGSHEGEPMSIYIDRIVENSWGYYIDAALDILSKPYPSRRRPSRRVVVTTELNVHIFNMERFREFALIFAAHGNAGSFKNALKPMYLAQYNENRNVLLPVSFSLSRNHDYLTARFPGMEEFAADQIRDDHVKKARVGGLELEDSPQFQNWVLDEYTRGYLTCMGLNIGGCTLKIKPDGSMYSHVDFRPVAPVVSLLEALLDCRGLIVQSDIGTILP